MDNKKRFNVCDDCLKKMDKVYIERQKMEAEIKKQWYTCAHIYFKNKEKK